MVKLFDMNNKQAWIKLGETSSKKVFDEANTIIIDGVKYYRSIKYICCQTQEEADERVKELAKELDNWIIVKYRNSICDHDLYLLKHYKEFDSETYNMIAERVNKSFFGRINLEGYEYVLYTTEK